MIYIITGVAGSGKTTFGKLLAQKLNLPFFDADNFHPASNVQKMHEGLPLNDSDRQPWLNRLAENIFAWQQEGGAVLACSALKERYRKSLMAVPSSEITWIYLKAPRELIASRLSRRKNHFFNARLLDSQFEALEEPAYGVHLDVTNNTEELLDILSAMSLI